MQRQIARVAMLSLAHRYNRSFVVTKQPPSCICVMFPETIFQSLWKAIDKVQVASTWNSFTAIYVISLSPSKSFLRNILLMVSSVWEIIYLTLQGQPAAKLWPGDPFFCSGWKSGCHQRPRARSSEVPWTGPFPGLQPFCSLRGKMLCFLLGPFSRWILNSHLNIISTPDWHLVWSRAGQSAWKTLGKGWGHPLLSLQVLPPHNQQLRNIGKSYGPPHFPYNAFLYRIYSFFREQHGIFAPTWKVEKESPGWVSMSDLFEKVKVLEPTVSRKSVLEYINESWRRAVGVG